MFEYILLSSLSASNSPMCLLVPTCSRFRFTRSISVAKRGREKEKKNNESSAPAVDLEIASSASIQEYNQVHRGSWFGCSMAHIIILAFY